MKASIKVNLHKVKGGNWTALVSEEEGFQNSWVEVLFEESFQGLDHCFNENRVSLEQILVLHDACIVDNDACPFTFVKQGCEILRTSLRDIQGDVLSLNLRVEFACFFANFGHLVFRAGHQSDIVSTLGKLESIGSANAFTSSRHNSPLSAFISVTVDW